MVGVGVTKLLGLSVHLDPRVNERLDALFSTDHNAILNAWFRGPMGAYLTQWTNFNRNWAAQAMISNINSREVAIWTCGIK